MEQFEIKNSKTVTLSDHIRFRCKRCGECCRNVKGAVILESLDAYRLAKHLKLRINDIYEKFAQPFVLNETGFPIFALKVKGKNNECIFLDGCRCTVREGRPRTCRLYPFWVEPTDAEGGIVYNYCSEREHHPNGTLIRVKDWMNENLYREDREYLAEEYRAVTQFAPLLHEARRRNVPIDAIQRLLLFYRCFAFEIDEPFMEQFKRNNTHLHQQMIYLILGADGK